METTELFMNPVILTSLIVGASIFLLMYILKSFRQDTNIEFSHKNEKCSAQPERKKTSSRPGKSKKKASENHWIGRNEKQTYSHPWLLTSLKGHSGTILDMDFSANGKFLTSCDDERAVFLWDMKDLNQKDRKSLRVNIEFDHATFVKWSPDSKAFIIQKSNENTVEVYKVEKKRDGWLQASKALTFPKFHETDIIGMGIASNGKFIMTCSNKCDMAIWDLKGQLLAKLDTYLMNTVCAKISPCGRYIVASGFSPEAKVWEVIFNASGEFQEVKQIKQLTLRGHSSGIYDVGFDVNSSHMASVSRDGTWNLYDTNVNYKLGENARIIRSGNYDQSSSDAIIALSPTADVIAIAISSTLALYSTLSGKLDHIIEDIFSGYINSVLFDSTGKYILTAGSKQIRIFHNITGYRRIIESAKEKLKEYQTSATKERLEKLIFESQEFINCIDID